MSKAVVTDFMLNLHRQLMADRKVSESTANKYIQNLTILNDGKPFKSLAFLRNSDAIEGKLGSLAPATKLTYYSALVSVLSLVKDKPAYKKTYTHWATKMNDGIATKKGEDPHKKSEKQEENWVSWSDVEEIKGKLAGAVAEFKDRKSITAGEWETLLQYLVLSLYTDVSPRRNQDYSEMYVVPAYTEDLPADKNYLDLTGKRFIYNRYKTAKKYAQQIVEIPAPLMDVIMVYLRRHPSFKPRMSKKTVFKFLVKQDGSPLNATNGITRILNKTFGKRIGSSMLRHIYLTDKYGDTLKEMDGDAMAMGHSVSQQREYVKSDEAPAGSGDVIRHA